MGINIDKTISRTFVIGGALGGAAGFLFGTAFSFSNTMGFLPRRQGVRRRGARRHRQHPRRHDRRPAARRRGEPGADGPVERPCIGISGPMWSPSWCSSWCCCSARPASSVSGWGVRHEPSNRPSGDAACRSGRARHARSRFWPRCASVWPSRASCPGLPDSAQMVRRRPYRQRQIQLGSQQGREHRRPRSDGQAVLLQLSRLDSAAGHLVALRRGMRPDLTTCTGLGRGSARRSRWHLGLHIPGGGPRLPGHP